MEEKFQKIYHQIANLGNVHGARKIVLFGSRARCDNRERSDIDIAVFGMPSELQVDFQEKIEQLPTLLDFDIVFVTKKTDLELLKNIEKDGVVLMNKAEEKRNKFGEALERMKEAIGDYQMHQITSIRDGVIQRFEFCTELAWKSTREYLIEQGYTELNSPKSVMKQAYVDRLIDDEKKWLELLNARNLTAHVYDEETAETIYQNIVKSYLNMFGELLEKLK